MPRLGLGVLKAREGGEVERAVLHALNSGYRLIDTAAAYRNEEGVGRAIAQSGIPREDIFLTSKVWNNDQGYEETMTAFQSSLDKLGTDYLDLYLIHWPVAGKFSATWRALEDIYRSGRAKAIGVSNFQLHHLKTLALTASIMPMVNQIELHPHLQQRELRDYARRTNMVIEAWRPIMMGEVMDIPLLRQLADRYGKSPVQITLRWLIQEGIVAIPKSVNPKRIVENATLFDFTLREDEMNAIRQLDQNRRLGPDPDNFNF